MSGVSFSVSGSTNNMENYLKKMSKMDLASILRPFAQQGVSALSSATVKETGRAASAWGYEIIEEKGKVTIWWTNSDIENGYPVAVMIQYGHGTGTGGYVQGRDYINPAIRPIFDKMAREMERVVKSA